jgi:excisionase family DNA binding protein
VSKHVSFEIHDLATHAEPHVTPEQLAPWWGVHRSTVIRWIKEGKLRCKRLPGGKYRIPINDARLFDHGLYSQKYTA